MQHESEGVRATRKKYKWRSKRRGEEKEKSEKEAWGEVIECDCIMSD